MDVQGLDRQLERCREARLAVVAIVGLAGTTETGSIDDLHAIADRAQGAVPKAAIQELIERNLSEA